MTAAILLMIGCATQCLSGAPPEGVSGTTLHVSKLGDNSDGSSWAAAYTTIQAALDAVPEGGGHRIAIRPDTYMEANIYAAHKGAKGAYNELIGDFDGSLGSGATGWVVIDSGDAQKGFKSYDWWGTIRSYQKGWSDAHKDETFSAIGWDRWRFAHLYATGGDGGLFFDGTDHVEPFSVVLEDCVSIGRAFGAGVASVLSRHDEPITFRRCTLWALDEWGDTAAGYVRVENEAMPDKPDALFEDCTLVGPQCSLKASNYGFHTYTRIALKDCRLITLNFSQPHGTPTDGIIQCVQNGKYLHVELEDCTLMGFKVFGVKVDKDSEKEIGFTTRGSVQAYVQFKQQVPKGFHRLGRWPVEVFNTMLPPMPKQESMLTNAELVLKDMCEVSPVVWKDRLVHMECHRPGHGGTRADYYLLLRDAETGEELARFAEGYGLASGHVIDGVFYASASRWGDDGNWNDVTLFQSKDLKHWEQWVAIEQENEHLFNSSFCKGPEGYVLAYESNTPDYPAFTTKFATSKDLKTWTKLPEATFGTNRYTACPCIRYENGAYYVLYLERRSPNHHFETYVTRSKDLKHWERAASNPVLAPAGLDEGINASDPDLIEFNGKTYVYYAVGDQLTWMNIKRAQFDGTVSAFFEQCFAAGAVPDKGTASPK